MVQQVVLPPVEEKVRTYVRQACLLASFFLSLSLLHTYFDCFLLLRWMTTTTVLTLRHKRRRPYHHHQQQQLMVMLSPLSRILHCRRRRCHRHYLATRTIIFGFYYNNSCYGNLPIFMIRTAAAGIGMSIIIIS